MYEKNTLLNVPEQKILELFLDLKKHYFAEISKKTGLTRPRTMLALRKLTAYGVFNILQEANTKYYFLKHKTEVFSFLSQIEYSKTNLFFEKQKTIKRAIDLLKEKYKDYLVLLIFGSYAKGYAAKTSDIDLLIIKENFSKTETKALEELIGIINGRIGLRINIYQMKISEFKKRNDFAKEIIDHHIIIEGGELFFRMALE